MATSLEPQTQQHYVDCDEYIDFQLRKTRTNVKWTDILTAGAGVATLVLAYILAFVVLDHWVVPGGFGYTARVLMLSALVLASVAWIAWRIVLPYLRSVNGLFAARMIEKSDPSLKGTLLNLVDLQRAGRPFAAEIRSSLEKRAAVSLAHMDVNQAVDRRPLMRLSYALLAVVVLFCLYTVLSPKKISNSVWRALLPAANLNVATRTEILDVKPGDVSILARQHLEVIADLRGEEPERVTLFYTTADRRFADEPVEMRPVEDTPKRYRGMITGESGRGILQDMTYHVAAGDDRTRDFQVTVIQPPSAKVDEVHYEFPSYMQFEPKTQPGGHIDGWEGAKVTINATANMPVTSAMILFSDDEDTTRKAEEIPMQILGETQLTAKWELKFRTDGTYPRFYRIQCKNAKGDTDPDPTLYSIKIQPDQPPDVVLLDPVRDLERPANAIVPLLIQARDPDFMLRYVNLRLEKEGESLPDEEIFEGRRQGFRKTYEFDLKPRNLKTGDVITFWIEARDNKEPLGNRKNTPRLNIRIIDPVSAEEVQEQLRADKEEQQDRVAAADRDLNEEGVPDLDRPQEGEDEARDEKRDDQPKQPGDQPEAQPGAEEGDGEKKGAGNAADGDKSARKPGDAAQEGDGANPGEETKPGDGEKPESNDGKVEDDGEALRKLIEHFDEEQQRKAGEGADQPKDGDQSAKGDQPPKDGAQPQDPTPGEQQPKDGPKQGDQQSPDKQSPDKQTGEDKRPKPDNGEKGAPGEKPSDPMKGESDPTKPDGADGTKKPSDSDASKGRPGAKDDPNKSNGEKPEGDPSKPMNEGDPAGGEKKPMTDQPGDGTEDAPPKPGETTKPTDKPDDGTEKPADPSDDASRKKANGDEEGKATPDRDPNADPTPAKNKLDRDPNEKPETRQRPGQKQPGKPPEGSQDSGKPAGSQPNGGQPKDGDSPDGEKSPSKSTDGQGKPSGDPAGDMGGEKKPPGSPEKGADGQQKPGDGQAKEPNGQPGQPKDSQQPAKPSEKQDGNPQGGEKGGQEGQQEGQNGQGKQQSDKPGQGQGQGEGQQQGEGSDQPGKQPGGPGNSSKSGAGNETGGERAGGPQGNDRGDGEGGGEGAEAAEEANLEFTKQATDLALKRLEDEIERGEVDQELLEKLGWNEADAKKFADRVRQQLAEKGDESPESLARRRQFEETLKSLDLRSRPERRDDPNLRKQSQDGIGPRRAPVPAEYREAYELYRKTLGKQSELE